MAWSVSRYRKLKWLSLVLAGCSFAIFLVSLRFHFGFAFGRVFVSSTGSCISIRLFPLGYTASEHLEWFSERLPRPRFLMPMWKPSIQGDPSSGALLTIPFWIPFLLPGGAFVFFHRKARLRPGHCIKCDYDMTGNTTGVCPECGCEIARK